MRCSKYHAKRMRVQLRRILAKVSERGPVVSSGEIGAFYGFGMYNPPPTRHQIKRARQRAHRLARSIKATVISHSVPFGDMLKVREILKANQVKPDADGMISFQ